MNDPLTGLLNWDAFRLLVEHELRVARRSRRRDTLLVIAIGDLQAIYEDRFEEGDETVRAVGELLRGTARDSDVVGRIGRDTFAVFALDCEGSVLANRISASVSRAAELASTVPSSNARALNVGMSIGITEVRANDEFEPLMARALTVLPNGRRTMDGHAAAGL